MSETPSKGKPPKTDGDVADRAQDEAVAPSEAHPLTLREYLDSLAEEETEESSEPEESPELWVSFSVGDAIFGLPVDQVREVIRVRTITRVPRSPEALRGVTNLRGRVLAVVDLRVRLGVTRAEITEASRILVAQGPAGPVGLLVDRVEQMEQVLPSAAQEPPDHVADLSFIDLAEISLGVVPRTQGLLVLLDLGILLQPPSAAA